MPINHVHGYKYTRSGIQPGNADRDQSSPLAPAFIFGGRIPLDVDASAGLKWKEKITPQGSYIKPEMEKPMTVTVNVSKLLTLLKAKAASNATKYQQQLDTFNTKREEFLALAKSNGQSDYAADTAMEHLGIRQPIAPATYAADIQFLELIEGETMELESGSRLYTVANQT